MKKFFKVLGIIVLLIVAFFLIAGLFVKKDYHFERSITINAPKDVVWQNVSRFENFKKWNPFGAHDANMTSSIEGTDGTVGAVYRWKGNKDVGSGSQTYKEIEPQKHVGIDLLFEEPFKSHAYAFINVADDGAAQKVTWGFDNHSSYPFNTMSLFFDMDKMMDPDFTQGLKNLKQLCESGMPAAQQPSEAVSN